MLNFKKTNVFKCVAATLLVLTMVMVGLVGCGEEELPTVSGITISAQPTKVQYEVGEKFDYTGAKVKVTYDDGTSEEVDVTAAMIDLYSINFDSKGSKDITVTYTAEDGTTKTAVISVTVIDTLGDKKAAQIKVINDYTNLTDSAIVALKATYINSVNGADDAADIDSIVKAYKDAVDAYKKASETLTKAIADAKAKINGTKVDDIPKSLQPTVASYKAMALSALELAGSADEAKGIADAYVAAVAEVKKDLGYRLEVDAAAIAAYAELCKKFDVEQNDRAPYYTAENWVKIVAAYDEAKAAVLRAEDVAAVEAAVKAVDEAVAEIKSVLDELYDLIVKFEEKAIDEAGFVVYANNAYSAELLAAVEYLEEYGDARSAADPALTPAALIAELDAYKTRAGVNYKLCTNLYEYFVRYADELPDALTAAEAVVDAINALPEVLLYEEFKNSSIDGMNVAYYVTIKSDLTVITATVNNWLTTYKMIFKTADNATVAAANYAEATIFDSNIDDMITNFDVFEALVARQAALKDSAADLFAALYTIDTTAKTATTKLTALLNTDGNVALTDEEALAAIETAVAEWLTKYDLEPARIADYDYHKHVFVAEDLTANPPVAEEKAEANLAQAYAAIRAQRDYIEDMKDAKADYEADVKAALEAFNAKNPVFTTAYWTECTDIADAIAEIANEYNVDAENILLIIGEETFEAFMDCTYEYTFYLTRANNTKSYVVDKIDALLAEIDANTDKKITFDEIDELAAAKKALEEWVDGIKPNDTAEQAKNPDGTLKFEADGVTPVYDLTTRYVVDEDNQKAILGDKLTKLNDAIAAFDALAAEYADEVKAVNDAIAAIGTVTKESGAAIEAAREAFDEFIETIEAITDTLTADQIAEAFELDQDTLVAAEGKLVALYFEDIGICTKNIPAAITAIEVYINWSGVTTYNAAIEAIADDATNVVKFRTYATVFNAIAGSIADHSAISDDFVEDVFDKVNEIDQLCAECNTLNDMIANLPALAALEFRDKAQVDLTLDVYKSYLNNNSQYNADIVDEAKLLASVKKINELEFNATITTYISELAAEELRITTIIDESTTEGSVWEKSVKNVAAAAKLSLQGLNFEAEGALVDAAKILSDAKLLMRQHLTSYEATITP